VFLRPLGLRLVCCIMSKTSFITKLLYFYKCCFIGKNLFPCKVAFGIIDTKFHVYLAKADFFGGPK
ncbi:hypothetical protein PTB13_17500, partial [Bacillus sp. MHSD17]|nr:hypothetical protein [Bacillus sp. MHSD17]